MAEVATVKVRSSHPDHEQEFFVINEEDFDPKKHELWEEDKPAQPVVTEAHDQEARQVDARRDALRQAAKQQGQHPEIRK
jgi:hypothetical protein